MHISYVYVSEYLKNVGLRVWGVEGGEFWLQGSGRCSLRVFWGVRDGKTTNDARKHDAPD